MLVCGYVNRERKGYVVKATLVGLALNTAGWVGRYSKTVETALYLAVVAIW